MVKGMISADLNKKHHCPWTTIDLCPWYYRKIYKVNQMLEGKVLKHFYEREGCLREGGRDRDGHRRSVDCICK